MALVPRASARLARQFVHILLICGLLSCISAFAGAPVLTSIEVAATTPPTFQWYRGNTHTHTTNSDGDSSPLDVASHYKNLGYNFLVISDHNRLTEVDDLNAALGVPGQFLVMKGEEVTDYYNGSPVHINSLNNQTVVLPQHGSDVVSTIENNSAAIRQAGGLPYIAHPNFRFAVSADDFRNVAGTALFEIYNAHPVVNNDGDATHLSVEATWDAALSSGKLRYGIAADDEHTLTNVSGALPGRAWVMVRASSLDPDSITDAMQRGDFYASTGVMLQDYQVGASGISITVDNNLSGPTTIDFIGKNGRLLQRNSTSTAAYTFTGDEMYVRAKVVNTSGQAVWTQPVFTARLNASNAILNAASFGNEPQINKTVAPHSIAVASGLGLARATLQAERNSDGSFPTTLGGTTVTVSGRAAAIYYVSTTRVNFHVPDETEPGPAEVVITNADGVQMRSQIIVENVAPGIFTEDGSGRGAAVKFETTRLLPQLFFPNDGLRRFFIYATGVRAAAQVTVLVNGQPATIEAVRGCYRLPGLYQINLALPAHVIVTSGMTLVLKADGKDSNATVLQF
ncbi:MAG: CehA/McbA family metallohydrolase [Pyrinomonadaceae bacterium]|nr:CehA/McbA family metallohydrolase [Pyrinomonadaceae bacterium]